MLGQSAMTTIYLYVKTHNITGLKYLGKTILKDPHKYHGSGIRWTRHLKKHGYDYTTEILRECSSKEELKEWGLYYSDLWNVAKSREWANLKVEEGEGGSFFGEENGMHGKKHSEETRKKMSESAKSKPPRSKESIEKSANWHRGQKRSQETCETISQSLKGKPNKFKGVSYEEQFGEEKAAEMRRRNSDRQKGSKSPMYGRSRSKEAIAKGIESRKGFKHSEETKRKMAEMKKGKSPSNKGKSPNKIICLHCTKEISVANHNRWHGDNCKRKII